MTTKRGRKAIERYFGYDRSSHQIMNWNDSCGYSFKDIAIKLEAQIDKPTLED